MTTTRGGTRMAGASVGPGVTDDAVREVDCAVVVVAYNSAADVGALLAAVPSAAGDRTVCVTVVDNASADDITTAVTPGEGVRLFQAGANLGYAGAINVADEHLPRSRWVLVLNPDLVLDPGAIAEMVEVGTRSAAGAVVPRLLDSHGRTSPSLRREPSILRALGEALFGDHAPGRPGWAAEIIRDCRAYERESQVDWATGAAVLVRRSSWAAVGPWDTRFFLYSEETDFLRRLRERGDPVVHAPAAVAHHRGAGSGSSRDLAALLTVNRVRYFRKWHSPAASFLFALVAVLHSLLRIRRPEQRRALHALVSARVRAQLPAAPAVVPPPQEVLRAREWAS